MKIAICDDEKYDLEKIEYLIKKELLKHNISIFEIDTYLSSTMFLQSDEKIMQYDVIFLDINMPQINGIKEELFTICDIVCRVYRDCINSSHKFYIKGNFSSNHNKYLCFTSI